MSVEKNLGTLFLFSNKFTKGEKHYENHSKCNQNFTKEVSP